MQHNCHRVGILTASDRAHAKVYQDLSGARIKSLLNASSYEVAAYEVVPDDGSAIRRVLKRFADRMRLDLVITTGGTGLGPRDITPESTTSVCDRMIPGLADWLRHESCKITPMAVLSRGVSGMRGRTLIVNLPGSPQAVQECMRLLLSVLPHAFAMIRGGGHEERKVPGTE